MPPPPPPTTTTTPAQFPRNEKSPSFSNFLSPVGLGHILETTPFVTSQRAQKPLSAAPGATPPFENHLVLVSCGQSNKVLAESSVSSGCCKQRAKYGGIWALFLDGDLKENYRDFHTFCQASGVKAERQHSSFIRPRVVFPSVAFLCPKENVKRCVTVRQPVDFLQRRRNVLFLAALHLTV